MKRAYNNHKLATAKHGLNVQRFLVGRQFFGVLVVLAFGQLMPQLIASTHPITFMNLPGANFVINLCLGFEAVGVTHFSWVLTFITKWIFGLKNQEDFKITKSIGASRKRTTPFGSRLRRITPLVKPVPQDFRSFMTN